MGPVKSKSKAAAGPSSQAEALEVVQGAALVGARMDLQALEKIHHLVAGQTNEHGASALQAARFGRFPQGFYPIFLHAITAGLVPPYSPFLEAVLEFYKIQLLHLHPNSVLILSIFA